MVNKACICELFIKSKTGVPPTPFELRKILLNAGYDSEVRVYNEVIDFSEVVDRIRDEGLSPDEVKESIRLLLKNIDEEAENDD